ncbi:hypothetical protein C8R27_104120 [Nitrosomonas ureae]|uniref:hypothetical protein n=1 Tax=Nitrosomonas ureae TaxID=44577 RepID=UPI000D76FD8D|nr:hypothetical protein [Nitrosomonas ureae]PXX17229.1 hypothetical protein C8R27_104120 [Nitrosomonas ureae]
MKINSNLKPFNSLRELIFFLILILYTSASPPYAKAEDIENLQKNASITYEKMMQAKQNAETFTKDLTFAEKKLATAKQKLAEAEKAVETAKKKSEQARISMEKAIKQWKQASDALANEWGKTEVK